MPCSVTLPAGTGKTEIITGLASLAAQDKSRALILTHTHAGVEALRHRLKSIDIDGHAYRVETIASWAHGLMRAYPQLAEMIIPEIPDWSMSVLYHEGATRVVKSEVMLKVLAATYTFMVVDEYQDCTLSQHAIVSAIAEAIPVCVLGDPLQAVFGFRADDPLPSWADVESLFAPIELPVRPWRWCGHNEQLGNWLLAIRDNLHARLPIDLNNAPLEWICADGYATVTRTRRDLRNRYADDTIAVIGIREPDCLDAAKNLKGAFGVMETVEGTAMMNFAAVIDKADPAAVASETASWARTCATSLSSLIKAEEIAQLANGIPTASPRRRRGDTKQAHEDLSRLLDEPTPQAVRQALLSIAKMTGFTLYRYEAWNTVLQALLITQSTGHSVGDAVAQLRNRTRATGRRGGRRTVSRPTLIKGLEYDHAIIINADNHDPTSLYVALSRARKTLTIISAEPQLLTAPKATKRFRSAQRVSQEQLTLI